MRVAERPGSGGADAPPVTIETRSAVDAAVIWLHGLGADGSDFVPVVPELAARLPCGTRFIFPHAPYRPVTLNNGYVMRAWYDVALSDSGYVQNALQIDESANAVHRLVDGERARGMAASRIVLAGFSQGGLVALVAGLTYPEPLAGIVVLSAPVSDPAAICAQASPAQAATGIFLAHGREDSVAPFSLGEAAHEALSRSGYRVRWCAYSMGHTVCPEELAAIADFLSAALI